MWLLLLVALVASAAQAQESLFVVQSLDESLASINLTTGDVNTHVVPLGNLPNDILFHNGKLYVAISGYNSIQEIDPVSGMTLRNIPISGGVNPWSLTALNGDTLAVTCSVSNNVKLIRLSDGETVDSLEVGLYPEGILVNENYLFVTLVRLSFPNYGAGAVMVYDRNTLQFEDSISVGTDPQFLAVDAMNRLHVVCTGNYGDVPGEIDVVDLSTMEVTVIVNTGGTPATVSFGGGFGFVAAGGWGGNGIVYRYRLGDLSVVNGSTNPIGVGEGASDIEAMPDSTFYVSCFSAAQVEHRSSDGSLLNTYLLSTGPGNMVLVGEQNSGVPREAPNLPQTIHLNAYPNPFNSSTTVQLSPSSHPRNILIYNSLGQEVSRLHFGEWLSQIQWDGKDNHGVPLASGAYYATIEELSSLKPLMLLYLK